jgi:hypothetical protein
MNPAGMNDQKEMASRPHKVGWPYMLIAKKSARFHNAVLCAKTKKKRAAVDRG